MTKCKTRDDSPECDNRVAIRQIEKKNLNYPTYGVCAACMEGIRTRAYIKKIFENSKLVKQLESK